MLIKSVLFVLFISSICIAQGNAEPKSADPGVAATTEVSMADTLDFIKRKLSDTRIQDNDVDCSDGTPHQDYGSNTVKVTDFVVDGKLLTITEKVATPGSRRAGQVSTPPTEETNIWKFRLDQLDPTSVTVQRGIPQKGYPCLAASATSFVKITRTSGTVEHTWEQRLLLESDCRTFGSCTRQIKSTSDPVNFAFEDKQMAARVAKAFIHAIILASPEAKPDVF